MKPEKRFNAEHKAERHQDRPHVELSKRRRWAVTAGVMMGMFFAALEVTVVGTAMPTVIASLGGLHYYSWVFSAYLLTSTVTVPLWGRLSDLYGRRPLYLLGVALFLVGSVLSGASQSIIQLIIFRAVQGIGAGALIPLSLIINGDIYTPSERARIQGLFSGVWGVASVIGPVIGGFITDNLSWRWVFYINIPFGLAAAVIVGAALVEPRRSEDRVVDYAGAIWLTIAITLLLVALVETGDPVVWSNPLMWAVVAGIFIFGVLFVRTELRAADPIVPFSLFRNRVISVGSITSFLVGTAMFGAISFIPLFVQGTFGGTATEAGYALMPFLMGWVLFAVIGGRLMLKVGYRPTVLAGLAIMTAGFALLATFGAQTPQWLLLSDMGLMGSGIGLVVLALLITVQNSVERSDLGIATSLQPFARSIGGAAGVALMGAMLTLGLSSQMADVQRASGLPESEVARIMNNPSALIEPHARQELPPAIIAPLKDALGSALQKVFIAGAIFAALSLVSGFWLPSVRALLAKRQAAAQEKIASSPAECERLLMAEMTTLDPEHEPSVIAASDEM